LPYWLHLTADDQKQVLVVASVCSPMVVPLWLVSAPARCLAPALAEGEGEPLGTVLVAAADGSLADRNHAAACHTLTTVAQRAEDMALINWEQGGTAAAVDWTADPLRQISGEERSLCLSKSLICELCVHARQRTRKQAARPFNLDRS
jgi:hypothetical protein